ncbi:MAG: PilZ domain-containing protein [Gemmataceae bacterium]|nr:PilZ domain-containing protein [Gemmataceae bacterium]
MASQTNATGPNRRLCRRKTPRTVTKAECRRGAAKLGANLAVQFLDLSQDGLRLVVKETLPEKEEVEISIITSGMRAALTRSAEVVWSLPLENGLFCVGFRFHKRLPYRDLQQMARP